MFFRSYREVDKMATESFTRKIKITNTKAIEILADVPENENCDPIDVDPEFAERIRKCEEHLKKNPSQFKVFQQ